MKGSLPEALLLWIFRRFPPTDCIFKEPGTRAESEYADEQTTPFHGWFGMGPELFRDKDVLDLGCGFGGRAVAFREYGARSVTGIEVETLKAGRSRAFARIRNAAKLQFATGLGEALPFAEERFDLIVMYDVLEHVISPAEVLRECWRVLRAGGQLALTFPPYYALIGGSHLHGYATSFPGLNILFRTETLKDAARTLLEQQRVDYRSYLRECPSDELWNQNGLTVTGFADLLGHLPFRTSRLAYIGHGEGRLSRPGRAPWLRRMGLPVSRALARIPLVREAWCSRIVAILTKQNSPARA